MNIFGGLKWTISTVLQTVSRGGINYLGSILIPKLGMSLDGYSEWRWSARCKSALSIRAVSTYREVPGGPVPSFLGLHLESGLPRTYPPSSSLSAVHSLTKIPCEVSSTASDCW